MTEVLRELGETIARQRPDCVLEYNVVFVFHYIILHHNASTSKCENVCRSI